MDTALRLLLAASARRSQLLSDWWLVSDHLDDLVFTSAQPLLHSAHDLALQHLPPMEALCEGAELPSCRRVCVRRGLCLLYLYRKSGLIHPATTRPIAATCV